MNHRVSSQEQILDRTMEIAIREGVDQVSIRKIATACGIAIGSVYNYYKNKEELISAAAERFWEGILSDQDKVYRPGMTFTMFVEQYYSFLHGRLAIYDKSWLMVVSGHQSEQNAVRMLREVLARDYRVNQSIWNMELNEDAFCQYVMRNLIALLNVGENNCRFFTVLLEHLLYSED